LNLAGFWLGLILLIFQITHTTWLLRRLPLRAAFKLSAQVAIGYAPLVTINAHVN
jgi:hypothetical protein